jgi:hypothetical protein
MKKHLWSAAVLLLLAVPAGAEEFRRFDAIPSARQALGAEGAAGESLSPGTVPPVPPEVVRTAAAEIVSAWNTPALRPLLAPEFQDSDLLLARIGALAGRDARLSLLSVQSMAPMEDRLLEDGRLLSTVAVRLRYQVEFQTPGEGFQRTEGSAEFLLRFERHRAP